MKHIPSLKHLGFETKGNEEKACNVTNLEIKKKCLQQFCYLWENLSIWPDCPVLAMLEPMLGNEPWALIKGSLFFPTCRSTQRNCTLKVWQSRWTPPCSSSHSICLYTSATCVYVSCPSLTSSSTDSWSCCQFPSPWKPFWTTWGDCTSSMVRGSEKDRAVCPCWRSVDYCLGGGCFVCWCRYSRIVISDCSTTVVWLLALPGFSSYIQGYQYKLLHNPTQNEEPLWESLW